MDNIERTSTNILRRELADIYDKLDELVGGHNKLHKKGQFDEKIPHADISRWETIEKP